MIATAIPGTVLAFVITFGGAIYKSDGLELVNPRDRQGFTDGSLLSPVNTGNLYGEYTDEVLREFLIEKMGAYGLIDGQK